MLQLHPLDPLPADWQRLEATPSLVAFQSRAWLAFVAASHGCRPVVAEVRDGQAVVGWFTGLTLRRFGVRILGSPFPGWATQYMGFALQEGVPRGEALRALLPFAFEEVGCRYLEIRDRFTTVDDAAGLGLDHAYGARARFAPGRPAFTTYVVDLAPDEDELFARVKGSVRTAVRKAARRGLVVEEAAWDDPTFADEYGEQFRDVFARKQLVPPWGAERARTLMRTVGPAGRLLLLRARTPEGEPVGTLLTVFDRQRMYLWSGGSLRSGLSYQPNEALVWEAVRQAKARGLGQLDMGGGGAYKEKYGVSSLAVPVFRRSSPAVLSRLRDLAREAVATERRVRGRARERMHGSRRRPPVARV